MFNCKYAVFSLTYDDQVFVIILSEIQTFGQTQIGCEKREFIFIYVSFFACFCTIIFLFY